MRERALSFAFLVLVKGRILLTLPVPLCREASLGWAKIRTEEWSALLPRFPSPPPIPPRVRIASECEAG